MPDDDGLVRIGELCEMVDRRPNTVHVWELKGVLPKNLRSKRDKRGWRYWTPAQAEGIVRWMKATDRRAGKNFADPAHEQLHLAKMRVPRFLNKSHIDTALDMIEKGKTAKQIALKIHPKTRYKRWQNVDRALRGYFAKMGWPYPPEDPVEREVKRRVRSFDKAVQRGKTKTAINIAVTGERKR